MRRFRNRILKWTSKNGNIPRSKAKKEARRLYTDITGIKKIFKFRKTKKQFFCLKNSKKN